MSKKGLARTLGVLTAVASAFAIVFTPFILGIHPPNGRAGGAIFAIPALAAFIAPSLLIYRWGIRKFRRE